MTSYREYVGLWLNRRRVQALPIAAILREFVDLPGQSGSAVVEALADRPGLVRRVAGAVTAAQQSMAASAATK